MSTDHHFVITVQKPTEMGVKTGTYYGVIPVPESATREQIFRQAKEYAASQDPDLDGGNVVFFDVQPNQL